jgi:CheY-like chemotaxis protein
MAKPTILVVDDERLIRWSLTKRPRSEGYDVVEAEAGHDATIETAVEAIRRT